MTWQRDETCPHWNVGFDHYPTKQDDYTFFCLNLNCRAILDHDCDDMTDVDKNGDARCSECGSLRYVRPNRDQLEAHRITRLEGKG